jgi:hypothetical protein
VPPECRDSNSPPGPPAGQGGRVHDHDYAPARAAFEWETIMIATDSEPQAEGPGPPVTRDSYSGGPGLTRRTRRTVTAATTVTEYRDNLTATASDGALEARRTDSPAEDSEDSEAGTQSEPGLTVPPVTQARRWGVHGRYAFLSPRGTTGLHWAYEGMGVSDHDASESV